MLYIANDWRRFQTWTASRKITRGHHLLRERLTASLQQVSRQIFIFGFSRHPQLIQFAESSTICRHVVSWRSSSNQNCGSFYLQSICRYFGEAIDVTDKELVKTFCNRMCDVGFFTTTQLLSLWLTTDSQGLQISQQSSTTNFKFIIHGTCEFSGRRLYYQSSE